MADLTKRQEVILGLIVREYVETPTPVSSKLIVEQYDLGVSSATVRNDMVALEEAGMIASPHVSAGRVPTEAGYRYFVQRLIRDTDLSMEERRMIDHQFHQTGFDVNQSLRLAASMMAQSVRAASLITSPRVQDAEFKHVQLIQTQGRMVLMILVVEGGDFRQQMLQLAEPVTQEQLTRVSGHVNTLCSGKDSAAIRRLAATQPTLEAEVMTMTADLLDRVGGRPRIMYTDGLMNIIDTESEDALFDVDAAGTRQTLRLLEEQHLLEDVLVDALEPNEPGVLVIISGDNRWEDLTNTTMILSRYGAEGMAMGALGVLGPTRLPYARAVAVVRYMADIMSEMLTTAYSDPQDG